MDPVVADDVRNGLVGVYAERKKLVQNMLNIASALEGPLFLRNFRIDRALRKQMAAVRRMDLHLNRMNRRLKRGDL